MGLKRKRFEPQGNPRHAVNKRAEREAIAEAISKYGVPDNIYVDSGDSDEYYEALIQGEIPARSTYEKVIQRFTRTDAGLVLAAIGLEHPASALVYEYLANQKFEKINPRAGIIRGMISSHRNCQIKEQLLDIDLEKIKYYSDVQEIAQVLRNLRCQHSQSQGAVPEDNHGKQKS